MWFRVVSRKVKVEIHDSGLLKAIERSDAGNVRERAWVGGKMLKELCDTEEDRCVHFLDCPTVFDTKDAGIYRFLDRMCFKMAF